MILATWIILIIWGFFFRNSKKISFFQMLFMIILIVNNVNNPDYSVTENSFNMAKNGIDIFSGNWLLKLIYFVIGFIGNFQMALFVIALLSFCLIYKAILFYTDKISYVLSLYMIASFVIDATQIKNFFAMAIWLYFSRFLYDAYVEKKNTNSVNVALIWKYILGVFLAMSIHVSFAITIVYLLIIFMDTKKMVVLGIIMATVSCLSANITSVLGSLAKQLSRTGGIFYFVYDKFIAYSYTNSNNLIVRLQLEIIFFGLVTFIFLVRRNKGLLKLKYQFLPNFMFDLNIVVLIIIPLMFFSTVFYRFQRNLLVIIYSVLANALVDSFVIKRIQKGRDIITFLVSLAPAFFYLLIDAIIWNYDAVFMKLFWMS